MRIECNQIANEENKVECLLSEGDSGLYLTVSNKEMVAEIDVNKLLEILKEQGKL